MKKLNLFYYLFLIFTVISLINLNLNKALGVSLIKLQKSESNFTELVKCPVEQIFSNKAKKCMQYTKIETKLDCSSLIYQNIFNSEDTFYCFDIKSNKLNIEAHRLLGDKFQKYNTSLSLTSQSDISKSDNLYNSVFKPFKNSKYFYGLITFGMGNTNLYLYKFGRDLNKVKISNQLTINHQSGSIFFKDVYDLRDNRNFKLIIGYRDSIESFSVYILNG